MKKLHATKSAEDEEPECLRMNFNSHGIKKPLYPALILEPALYTEHVKDLDLSETQQRELLETLWSIMVAFVDLGFAVDKIDPILDGIFAAGSEIRHSKGDLANNKKPQGGE